MNIHVRTKHDRTQRPHEETGAKSHQRQHQRDEGYAAREESVPNGRGVVAEHHEVVHFQEISTGNTHYRPELFFSVRRIGRSECAILNDWSGCHMSPSNHSVSSPSSLQEPRSKP